MDTDLLRSTAEALSLDRAAIDSVRPWRSYLTHHLWAASAQLQERTRT